MNLNSFLLHHPEVPFNFGWNADDFDQFWHSVGFDELKGTDPCTWSEDDRTRANTQCDEWIALWHACSQGEHHH